MVALIAERHLAAAAAATVNRLLAMDRATSMADVANWADERCNSGSGSSKHTEHGNGYYHSVDHSMVHRPTREPDFFSAVTAICGDDGPTFSHLLASRRPRGREAAP
jgi:hypothetical protein